MEINDLTNFFGMDWGVLTNSGPFSLGEFWLEDALTCFPNPE